MTLQYDQPNINLRDTAPIAVTTPDATPVVIPVGIITDGQNLSISLIGGGSAPGVAVANNYVVDPGGATFVREAGVGFASVVIGLTQAGGPVAIGFATDDVTVPGETICSIVITGPAFPYAHNLRYSAVKF